MEETKTTNKVKGYCHTGRLVIKVYIVIKVKSGSVVKVLYLFAAVVGSLSSLSSYTGSLAYLGDERLCQIGKERASWKSSESHIL